MSYRQWTVSKDHEVYSLSWHHGEEARVLGEVAEAIEGGRLPLGLSDLTEFLRMLASSMRPEECPVRANRITG